jgi:hypothetical protein
MALAIAKSGLFGMKTPDQALALMAVAQAEGMHPALACMQFDIIQGRPARKAEAIQARFQQAGGTVEWKEYTDTVCTAVFSHPQGGSVPVTWTIEMAEKIGLASKENWRKYPRAMLRARVISEGVRTVYPGANLGFYTPEEVQDFDDRSVKEVKVEVLPPEPEEPVGEFVINLPGGKEYNRFTILDEAKQAYFHLVDSIHQASKLTPEAKQEKAKQLAAANQHLFVEHQDA